MSVELTDGLREILAFVRGYRWPGARGIRTFIGDPDDGLHADLLRLEEAGAVRRAHETPGWVQWEAVEGWDEPAKAGGEGR